MLTPEDCTGTTFSDFHRQTAAPPSEFAQSTAGHRQRAGDMWQSPDRTRRSTPRRKLQLLPDFVLESHCESHQGICDGDQPLPAVTRAKQELPPAPETPCYEG